MTDILDDMLALKDRLGLNGNDPDCFLMLSSTHAKLKATFPAGTQRIDTFAGLPVYVSPTVHELAALWIALKSKGYRVAIIREQPQSRPGGGNGHESPAGGQRRGGQDGE